MGRNWVLCPEPPGMRIRKGFLEAFSVDGGW
jgi:hypothetical protein